MKEKHSPLPWKKVPYVLLETLKVSNKNSEQPDGYFIETHTFPPGSGFTVVKIACIDCRLKGSNIKPEFWE